MKPSIRPFQLELGICLASWLFWASCLCATALPALAEPESDNATEAPYPRIAMLWAPIRGDRSVKGMVR
ncbi:MAG: hypothetical protein JSW27_11265, partial [Phycisphaerales bacterium]